MTTTEQQTKVCTRCHTEKDLDEFPRDSSKPTGRRSYCKSCHAEHARSRRAADPEKLRAQARRYREEHPDQTRETARRYRAKHAEKISEHKRRYREEHPEQARAWNRHHHQANPHVGWATTYRRRARRYGLPVIVEPFTRQDVVERYGDACHWCDAGAFEELDHEPAVRDGGTHTLDDVRPSCTSCNNRRELKARKARRAAQTTTTEQES